MMDPYGPDELDRQLGDWLREESWTRAPAGLVEDVFAETSRTHQARRWTGRQLATALAGIAAVLVVVVTLGVLNRAFVPGPATVASPLASPSASPTPAASVRPTPEPTPVPSPAATMLDTYPATSLSLGANAAPIAVVEAFGSIWVADIHANDVRRYDPATMRELKRIPVRAASWFAVTDDALWVTSQNGTGVYRIDPATNTVVTHVGDVPPCGAPFTALDSLWMTACDANQLLRIDPVQDTIVATIGLEDHTFVVAAGGGLVAAGRDGLARLDPASRTFTPMPNKDAIGASFVASDGESVWVASVLGLFRLDPADGSTIARFDYTDARGVAFSDGSAWVTRAGVGVVEIDLATNKVLRTIPMPGSPLVPWVADGMLWVTDFDGSTLWRIELPSTP